jgi:hypothetical protein
MTRAGISVTELEYAEACRKKIPALVFLLRDDATWPKKDKNLAPIRKLRGRLKGRCAAYFADEKELALEVLAALRVLESTQFAKQLEAIDVIQQAQELGPSYLMNIQKKLGALGGAPLIEFQIGPTPWWNTRLHLVAALAQDLGGVREFVFVDEERRFLTMAPPAEIRDRLAQRWPALDRPAVPPVETTARAMAVEIRSSTGCSAEKHPLGAGPGCPTRPTASLAVGRRCRIPAASSGASRSSVAGAARSADERQAEVLDGARPLRRNASLGLPPSPIQD